MSTFDSMCDWQQGQISDRGAMICCLENLKIAVPGIQYHESFVALYKVVQSSIEPEKKQVFLAEYFAWCRGNT